MVLRADLKNSRSISSFSTYGKTLISPLMPWTPTTLPTAMVAPLLNYLQHRALIYLCGCGGKYSPYRLCGPSLLAYDLSNVLLRNGKFNDRGPLARNLRHPYLFRVVYKRLCDVLNHLLHRPPPHSLLFYSSRFLTASGYPRLLKQGLYGRGGNCPVFEPLGYPLVFQLYDGWFLFGVVCAQNLKESPVPRTTRVGGNNAVERFFLGAAPG